MTRIAPRPRIGHVHLKVADLDRASPADAVVRVLQDGLTLTGAAMRSASTIRTATAWGLTATAPRRTGRAMPRAKRDAERAPRHLGAAGRTPRHGRLSRNRIPVDIISIRRRAIV
jgi:hypothetical protein